MSNIYYSMLDKDIEYSSRLSIAEANTEFVQWIYENGMLDGIDDVLSESIYLDENVSQWFTNWKINMVGLFKTNLNQFIQYANAQIAQNQEWLKKNKETILNKPIRHNKKSNVPDFKVAITRMQRPIIASPNTIDLERIETETDSTNAWLKKILIPSYNETVKDFARFSKEYYSGMDKKRKYSTDEMHQLLYHAYTFCLNYNHMVNKIKLESNSLVSYINRDPRTGQIDSTNQQVLKQQATQQTSPTDGSASSNAIANTPALNSNTTQQAIRASVEYDNFMSEFFSEADNVPTASTTQTPPKTSGSSNTVSNVSTVPRPTTTNVSAVKNTTNTTPGGKVGVDKGAVLLKKKQLACNILKECFTGKATAVNLVYRNLFNILRSQVTQ